MDPVIKQYRINLGRASRYISKGKPHCKQTKINRVEEERKKAVRDEYT